MDSKPTTQEIPYKKLLLRKKFSGFKGIIAFFLLLFVIFAPMKAHAFSLTSFLKELFFSSSDASDSANPPEPTATKPFPFLSAVPNSDSRAGEESGGELQVVDDTSLAAAVGPLGNAKEAIESPASYKITTYVVHEGDTLGAIAKSFGVSVSTIKWANNIPRGGSIKKGDELVILPVSGVRHIVVRGDTAASISKKYGGDPDDILNFNDLSPGEELTVGSEIIVPDGEISAPSETPRPGVSQPRYVRGGGPEIVGYFMRPILGAIRTRGIHGYNGIDLAASLGTTVRAAAAGTVIIARQSGWNGGYGKYVVISHPNGTQTLYGHLDTVNVAAGQEVAQGQQVGLEGSTGRSTGPHLHFEVRGARNPF